MVEVELILIALVAVTAIPYKGPVPLEFPGEPVRTKDPVEGPVEFILFKRPSLIP